ncbi:MAG: hypothetical protein U0990_09540 [Candidatus Nanopelagicales bacterium]|nr:hypothetical protein [Candidatus Nanopelagicales bacterium]
MMLSRIGKLLLAAWRWIVPQRCRGCGGWYLRLRLDTGMRYWSPEYCSPECIPAGADAVEAD